MISLIAAIGKNRELGAGNALLWHLPDDFKWFVKHTKNKAVIMGRNTMDSLGKPLKNRLNIVMTRSNEPLIEGFVKASNWEEALGMAREFSEEIMIIGGAQIYNQAIEFADQLILTHVDAEFNEADVFFPVVDSAWKEVFNEFHEKDETHAFNFNFAIYEK
jgi:dihydrofolate reductase